ncbi:MAG: GNAT family N-acetyltransferase [Bryobacteraceae bacterium]
MRRDAASLVLDPSQAAVVPIAFDSEAFGFPFYRVSRVLAAPLVAELAALKQRGPFAADAKCRAEDIENSRILMDCGFRKVCMQVTLMRHLEPAASASSECVAFADRLEIGEAELHRHARNFTADRFALDPLLPSEGHDRLYAAWLRNSLGGAAQVAYVGRNLCTFTIRGDELVIDLVSILDHRQGIGSRILHSVVGRAAELGLRAVRVTTECENVAAWSMYMKQGFTPISYTACFHLFHEG